MNFKEALIAHLQGENVEGKGLMTGGVWGGFGELVKCVEIGSIREDFAKDYEFRLAPRTIMCNGVEVVAGENEALEYRSSYYLADPDAVEFYVVYSWTHHDVNKTHLQRGLVYLNKEDAIARAKAMLIVKEG